jgi:hypothetical protein
MQWSGGACVKSVRIGCGAGFSGDRLEPAVDLAERGDLDYLVFECLSERTMALAHLDRSKNAEGGFDPLLVERMRAVLPICQSKGTRIISNMGAANPLGAVREVVSLARSLGLDGLRIACVTGDDVLSQIVLPDRDFAGQNALPPGWREDVISANAYLGAEAIVKALQQGADVVLTGRTADPSLFLGALAYEFSWDADDWQVLGQGTLVGHLLECAGQLTGGYFADPGYKEVPMLAQLGFPFAEVAADGSAMLLKLADTGGVISRATCIEQLLYEVQDPAAYITPDVIADFSTVEVEAAGLNAIHVSKAGGRPRPSELKVSLGLWAGYFGEGQISYAGSNAPARAKLAQSIVTERLTTAGLCELECSLMGLNSIHGESLSPPACAMHEVRLRVAGRANSMEDAERIRREVEALYVNGPAGGGGVTGSARRLVAVESVLIHREAVQIDVYMEEV